MRYIFKFPDIGEGIMEGKILEWYVQKGQEIKSGDPIVKMETDKIVTDIPSPKDGIISAVFGKEGDLINVEDPLIELEIKGLAGAEAQQAAKEKAKPMTEETVDEKGFGVVGTIEVAGDSAFLPSSDEAATTEVTSVGPTRKKALATPVARAMAKDYGIDINEVPGSGPAGRVMKTDIKHFHQNVQQQTAPQDMAEARIEIEDLSQIRKTIARRMSESKHNAAHMTVIEEVEISELIKLRESHKDQFADEGLKITYLPFILKAVAVALRRFPSLNSEIDLEKNKMIYKKYYNLGVAVDTEEGLVVPVIRDVDKRSVREIVLELNALSQKARERKLTLDDFKDGTFSVTNYGSIGGTFGVPVINYPQAAILGVGRILKTPVVKNDNIEIGYVLPLSMSVDHRIVDGGDAARFINMVKEFLADPVSLLLI